MEDGVLFPPPPFSFVYSPAFTYLCIISHQCNASESNLTSGMQDSLIHQKASNLIHSFLLACTTSVNVWDNIWRHYNDDFINSDLIGLNDWHVGTVNSSWLKVFWNGMVFPSITGWKRGFPLLGNNMENTWKPQVSNMFPRKKTPYAPVSAITWDGNLWKAWVFHIETRGKSQGNPVF